MSAFRFSAYSAKSDPGLGVNHRSSDIHGIHFKEFCTVYIVYTDVVIRQPQLKYLGSRTYR